MSRGMEVTKSSMEKWVGERGEELILIGGDFNARIGEEGRGCEGEEGRQEQENRKIRQLTGKEEN